MHYPPIWDSNAQQVEANMFLTAKLNLVSGMVIGAAAVMVMKQMCKRKRYKKHQEAHEAVAASD